MNETERLYKNGYLIAVYEYDEETDSEGICLCIIENIKKLLEYFKMEVTDENVKSMKNKIYYSIRKARRSDEQIIRVSGERYVVSLIPSKRKRKRKSECIVEGEKIYDITKRKTNSHHR